MPVVSFSVVACRALVALLAGMALAAFVGGSGYAADAKTIPMLPSQKLLSGTPSGSELVGKLLAERTTSSDPDVPLPQRDLIPPAPAFVPLAGPRIYGRGEEGSVVLGLKIPIPADRGLSQQNTRYSRVGSGSDPTGSTR